MLPLTVILINYIVMAKVRERLTARKQAAQKFDGERFNLKKLNDLQVRKQWESIKENIKTSAKESPGLHEMKQHKPWFDEECLGILGQRKQAKMQWIQDVMLADISGTKRRHI
jgi:hypothetical protein